jgi:hypothetical protein
MAQGKAQTVEQHTKLPARAQRPNVRLVRVTSNLAAGSSRQIPALPVMGKRDGQTFPEMCPHCNSEIPNHTCLRLRCSAATNSLRAPAHPLKQIKESTSYILRITSSQNRDTANTASIVASTGRGVKDCPYSNGPQPIYVSTPAVKLLRPSRYCLPSRRAVLPVHNVL